MTLPVVRKIANASWILFLAAVIGNSFLASLGMKILNVLLALLLAVVGAVLAIVSLLMIRRVGRRDVLAPALCGLISNALLLTIAITNFLHARAAAGKT